MSRQSPALAPPPDLRSEQPGFDFVQAGDDAAICHDGTPILRLRQRAEAFGGAFRAWDQHLEPDAGPEVAMVPLLHMHARQFAATTVRYTLGQRGPRLRLHIEPTDTKLGPSPLQIARETCTLAVELRDGGFHWSQQQDVRFFEDVSLDDAGGEVPLQVFRFHHQDDRPGVFLQFADPLPSAASGPAVPMTRDWTHQSLPYCGPRTFRDDWRRRYIALVLQDPDGSYAWSRLNKTKWMHLAQDNRRARPCHPSGMTYIVADDGSALAYRCDAPSHYHHVCEWGIDFHFWCDLEPFADKGVIPAGTHLTCTTHVQRVPETVLEPIFAKARELTLSEAERRRADAPAYDEPVNRFTRSVLECDDASPWEPSSEGCAWLREGGREPGTGCLLIRNDVAHEATWTQPCVGPSFWGNPFVAGARYCLSAWVKLDRFEPDPSQAAGPQVGAQFVYYEQSSAAGGSPRVLDAGWSEPIVNRFVPLRACTDWQHVRLITPACPEGAMSVRLMLRLNGYGEARFADVSWGISDEADESKS